MHNKLKTPCPLCHSEGSPFYKDTFFICGTCKAIFRPKKFLPQPEAEKIRYEKHTNDTEDSKHREFVSPITSAIMKNFAADSKGLDFGSGPDSVVSRVLEDAGYQIEQYDPFFKNDPELLQQQYDYIICCEVIEHFHNPEREFTLLKNLLNPGGMLYCMTYIYSPEIDFASWYYKNDLTHVFFFQEGTLKWIKDRFGFSSMVIDKRLILFGN